MQKKFIIIFLLILTVALWVGLSDRKAVGQVKKEPLKIGLLVERTGGLAAYGYSHERVMVAAINKVNKEGGIHLPQPPRYLSVHLNPDFTQIPEFGVPSWKQLS